MKTVQEILDFEEAQNIYKQFVIVDGTFTYLFGSFFDISNSEFKNRLVSQRANTSNFHTLVFVLEFKDW